MQAAESEKVMKVMRNQIYACFFLSFLLFSFTSAVVGESVHQPCAALSVSPTVCVCESSQVCVQGNGASVSLTVF